MGKVFTQRRGSWNWIQFHSDMENQQTRMSWWRRTFGRSVISMLFGTFFEKKTNTASIVAIMLVTAICYSIVVKDKFEYMNLLFNLVFVVVGYYFGAKQESTEQEEP